ERFHRVGADSRDAQLRHPLSLRPHRRCLWLCWTVEDAVVERYAVRSQERPMAFTRWEFLRGAVAAWIAFLVIAPVVHVAVSLLADEVTQPDGLAALLDLLTYFLVLWLWFATSVILPWSFGALVILGLPLATALGLALRGVQDRRIH